MALKPCSECKKEISSEANPCPNCGKKNPHKSGKLLYIVGGSILFFAIVGAASSGSSEESRPRPQTAVEAQPEQQRAQPAQPEIAVDVVDLHRAYHDNEVAADNSYKGRAVRVTGLIDSIDKTFGDSIVIHLKAKGEFMSQAGAFLQPSQAQMAATLKKGTRITLSCVCKGMTMGIVSLHNCSIN